MPAPSLFRSTRGVALPMVLLALGLLTAIVVAGVSMNSVEGRVNDNTVAQSDAYALAQSGLQQFLVNRTSLGFNASPPAVMESTRVALTGGYADVVLQRIRPQVVSQYGMYVLRSTGVRTGGNFPGAPNARRSVAQLVRYNSGTMVPAAGWTSLTGIQKTGGAGTISGVNNCGVPADTVAGVAVPNTPGYTQSGGSSIPRGAPNIDSLGSSYSAAAAQIPVDWDGILNRGLITPDYVIPGATWNAAWFGGSNWPVIRVNNDPGAAFVLPGDGRGILIVTGAMTVSGSQHWDGLVMVGRTLTVNGNATFRGAVYTGLNLLTSSNPDSLGAAMGRSDMGNGTKTIRYDACALQSALGRYKGLQAINNAWTDDWGTY